MSFSHGEGTKKVTLAFNLKASGQSPYWSILKYYQQLEKEALRSLIWEAVSAYWSVHAAYLNRDENSKEKTPQSDVMLSEYRPVTDGLYRLTQQVNFLSAQFEVCEPVSGISPVQYKAVEAVAFEFSYQVYDTSQFELVHYLMDSTGAFSLEQKILWSNLAYWGAIADRELGLLEPEQLNQSAANCIYRLREHIDYLKNYFNYCEWNDVSPSSPTVRGSSIFVERSATPEWEQPYSQEKKSNGNGVTPLKEENLDDFLLNDPINDEWRKDFFKKN